MKRYLIWLTLVAFLISIPAWAATTSGSMEKKPTTEKMTSPKMMHQAPSATSEKTKMHKAPATKGHKATKTRSHKKMTKSHKCATATESHKKMTSHHKTHKTASTHKKKSVASSKKTRHMAMENTAPAKKSY